MPCGATEELPEPDPTQRVRVPLALSIPRHLTDNGFTVEISAPTRRTLELFDTGDRRLAAAGAELSFSRRDGWRWRRDNLGNHKLPVREWSAPGSVDAQLVADWSRGYRRGRPLASRAKVSVQRRTHTVSGSGLPRPVTIIEERVDDGSPSSWTPRLRRILVADADSSDEAAPITRLFARVAVGDAATLAVLRPGLVRAPRLRLPDRKATGPRDLFSRSTTLSMIQWLHFDGELAGAGSPDALRKVRVALRRLRSDLQTFAPLLDGDWAAALRERLGGFAARLGTVRDAEVLSGRLSDLTSLLSDGDRESAMPLLDTAAAHLATARTELLDELSRAEYLGVIDDTIAAVTQPRWSDGADGLTSVTPLAARRWRRLRQYVAALDETPTDEQLHRIRILAKRVRYAADASVPEAGEAAASSAARVAELQTVLGEQHDAVVTREWLQRQAEATTGVAFAAGQLAALELARLRHASERWPDAWRAASRPRQWRWLRS
ncbi:MAG: CHAD domain-containing protein [Candidatus Dormibacteraeota bacterium]|uniref:CHAD domain-containing protein n=1 Tax=Candidatus Amunia macphersoniae TaxID=3127014 RepID=A0A934KPM8_9BACT|nr:CHAD domain-containing protein [Candidatus Dormibacteraeota bacterium]